jgi:hypothetical protein
MTTRVKIKITDQSALRENIDALYEKCDQVTLAKWALQIAEHILDMAAIKDYTMDAVVDGFAVNERWQAGNASVHEVRQASFKIHQIARDCVSVVQKTALRVAGQAVASGHRKEHAMVASDYAIKAVGLLYADDMDAITAEREWQLNALKKLCDAKNENAL